MKLKSVPLNALFKKIVKGEYHVSGELDNGTVPLISCKTLDYGVEGYFSIPSDRTYKNCVTIACDGMRPLTSFYHNYQFAAKDNVLICIPYENMKIQTIYYIIAYLNKMRWRFSYGRKFYANKISKISLLLPINDDGSIDEERIKEEISIRYVGSTLGKKQNLDFQKIKFSKFKLADLGVKFERKYAPYLNELEPGKIPYVTTTESDNGISFFVNEQPNFTKGTLTVSLDGSCGTTFYQFDDFISGEKTAVVTTLTKNEAYLLFYIGALIRIMSWRYHYGRKLSITRLNGLQLPFPIDEKGKIHAKFIKELIENTTGWNLLNKYI